jgi:hypothetical protein
LAVSVDHAVETPPLDASATFMRTPGWTTYTSTAADVDVAHSSSVATAVRL